MMKALIWHGPSNVSVETVNEPTIQAADDIIVKVTASAICGADIALYRGKIPGVARGDIPGHECMGEVVAAGPDVTRVKIGDRVVVPAIVACGQCEFCQHGEFASCETTNTGRGAISGHSQQPPGAGVLGLGHEFGGFAGAHAEYIRVPKGNAGPLPVPFTQPDDRLLPLAITLPAAWQAVVNSGIKAGQTLAIFGAGPVGLLAAASARYLGVESIIMIDRHADRLALAVEHYAVIPVDFSAPGDTAQAILEHTRANRGVDAAIDAVGLDASGSLTDTLLATFNLENGSGKVLRDAIASLRHGGTLSVAGIYIGSLSHFPFGDLFAKGITLRGGLAHVQAWMPELLRLIENGALRPEIAISHHLPLEQAPQGYQMMDSRETGCRKVVLLPHSAVPVESPLASESIWNGKVTPAI